jgi:predicted TIM-barrel fold metal-dependent hydrolase
MLLDCHVHVNAFTPEHGRTSKALLGRPSFRFLRWYMGMHGESFETERALSRALAMQLEGASELDAAVILAFDAVYDENGRLDDARTHLHVTNDYVKELTDRHPKMLFGASVHPYRRDAVAELERCARNGAVLLKWLPITQGIDPSDKRCFPLYEALAHYGIPLLSHTGWEKTLPNINTNVADPALLRPALDRGVTVIAAHCGTRSAFGEKCYVNTFVRMAKDHEHFFGDTSALNLPTRCYAYPYVMEDDRVRAKLVHGSDWPLPSIPMPQYVGFGGCTRLLLDRNVLRRDIRIKRAMGFDDDYFHRAATLLRMPVHAPLRAPLRAGGARHYAA